MDSEASRIAATLPRVQDRLDSIDLVRGLVMVVMALDHTRIFVAAGGVDLRDVTEPAWFLTRWVTHICAPTFVFLAGLSAFLYGARGNTNRELGRFLFTRGLWLILLEVTLIRFSWTYSIFPEFVVLQVLWVIGIAMIMLSWLIHLPRWAVLVFALSMITLHNLLDGVTAAQFGQLAWLWTILHEPARLHPTAGITVFPLYSVIPWVGVMAAGYALGPVMLRAPRERRRYLIGLGGILVFGFLIFRATNLYGDPAPWISHESVTSTLLSFINTEKYPPSLLFLCMTLGPAIMALGGLEMAKSRWLRPLTTFGRVPLFFYIAHLFLIPIVAVVGAIAITGEVSWLVDGSDLRAKRDQFGLGLPEIYLFWGLVTAILYLPCRWYAEVKRRRNSRWLSYL